MASSGRTSCLLAAAVPLLVLALLALRYEACALFGAHLTVTRPLPSIGRSCVLLLSHAYEHIDVFAGAALCAGWHAATGAPSTLLMAERLHNRLYRRVVGLPHADVLFVQPRGGTTARMVDASARGRNVAMYLYEDTRGTGAYHLVRGTACPVFLVRVRSSAAPCVEHEVLGCARKTLGAHFHVEHAPLPARLLVAARKGAMRPEAWMSECLRHLYR